MARAQLLLLPLALALLAAVHAAADNELPLPTPLVALTSPQGQAMLIESTYRSDYFLLGEHYVSQINGAFCGVASSAMLLNALGVPRPPQDPSTFLRYNYFTQDNIFDSTTEQVLPKAQVLRQGMSLPELSSFLAAHPMVGSAYRHAMPPEAVAAGQQQQQQQNAAGSLSQQWLDSFRNDLLAALRLPDVFVVVNFDRAVLGEVGGGHHSPVGAYHAPSDSVLVLDVSRYKYTAWWVSISELYASASTTVDSATNHTRGLAFAWSTARYPDPSSVPVGTTYQPLTAADAQTLKGAPCVDNGVTCLIVVEPLQGVVGSSTHSTGMTAAAAPAAAGHALMATVLVFVVLTAAMVGFVMVVMFSGGTVLGHRLPWAGQLHHGKRHLQPWPVPTWEDAGLSREGDALLQGSGKGASAAVVASNGLSGPNAV